MIDFSPLSGAVKQLTSALEEQAREPDRKLLRAGLIQTFEYTYELSHKMLRRYLASIDPSPAAIEYLTFEDLIRRGDEAGLVQSPVAVWKGFREARSITSHTYNEGKADEVMLKIPAFHSEVVFLLRQLQERSGQGHSPFPEQEKEQ